MWIMVWTKRVKDEAERTFILISDLGLSSEKRPRRWKVFELLYN